MNETRWKLPIVLFILCVVGCGPTALAPGRVMPELRVEGWTNGIATDMEGEVVVLEVFATW